MAWRRSPILLLIVFFSARMIDGEAEFRPSRISDVPAASAALKLPLSFEANKGQTDKRVKFMARGIAGAIWLTSEGGVLSFSRCASVPPRFVGWRIEGFSPAVEIAGEEPLAGESNYLIGSDPRKWHTGVRHYRRVRYRNVYPDTDFVFSGRQGDLEFDVIVGPGGDPEKPVLGFEGSSGLTIDAHGDALVRIAEETVRMRRPRVFQRNGGRTKEIEAAYRKVGKFGLGFRIGRHDRSLPLIIDPVFDFSTFLGGTGNESAFGVAVDRSGGIYVTGLTSSINFPTKSPIQQPSGFPFLDAFVTKLDPAGPRLIYSTFLGGSDEDRGFAVAVDLAGSAYVTGTTRSNNFPVVNPVQRTFGGGDDAFISKLDPTGSSLVYSTYLGGSLGEQGRGIAVDNIGRTAVAGFTSSKDFPVKHALQAVFSGGFDDAFVAGLDSDGSSMFATYLGGVGEDRAFGLALDFSGDLYLTGVTNSLDFPTRNALQPVFFGYQDAFVTRIAAGGASIVYSTYLGGRDNDFGRAVAVDADGNAFVTGFTLSPEFPTRNAFQKVFGGVEDGFVSKLDAAGSALVYSTYLGGSRSDEGYAIALDAGGNAYVTGFTASTDFPTLAPIQPVFGGGFKDAFVTALDAAGSGLLYSTYLGGTGELDSGYAVAVDTGRAAVVAGQTNSRDFPLSKPLQSVLSGPADAFITKINPSLPLRTTWFAHAAVGGGYEDLFTLQNIGDEAVNGTLILTEGSAGPLQVRLTGMPGLPGSIRGSYFPIALPPGGTRILSAAPVDPSTAVRTGWARVETQGGQVTGGIRFQFTRDNKLQAVAGVLPSEPVEYSTIPVDNDAKEKCFTGFAIANPFYVNVDIELTVLDQDGNVAAVLRPSELNPLGPQKHVARFLHEYVPATAGFKGSVVIRSLSGNRFIAVALAQENGLLSVVPAIHAKAPQVP